MKYRVLLPLFSLLLPVQLLAANSSVEDAMAAAGEAVFSHRCKACHSMDPAKNTFGPTLKGVLGRPAGTQPRFDYSRAMRNSGLVWTEQNLRKWIEDNERLVPETRMRHVSITDVTEQDFLIFYLKRLN